MRRASYMWGRPGATGVLFLLLYMLFLQFCFELMHGSRAVSMNSRRLQRETQ
jgi:hypothetical protein